MQAVRKDGLPKDQGTPIKNMFTRVEEYRHRPVGLLKEKYS